VERFGSRNDLKDGIRRLYQGLIEVLLDSPLFITQPAASLVVSLEVRVGVDRVDDWCPFGPPVGGEVKDILHEDLVVNKNSAAEIFPDALLVVLAIVFIDSVRITILLLPDGLATGDWR